MRIATHGIVAALALLIGLGAGYVFWGVRATNLDSELQRQRSDCEFRLAEQERRAKAAEERAGQEAEARKVLEEQLQKVQPQK